MLTQKYEPIAIVGSDCRFPGGSSSTSSLWELLKEPRDISKEISDDRFELKGYYHPKGSHHGTTNVQRAYMLDEDPRVFDANFFNISPNEADSIDPQQRLLMEVVYSALEAGGHRVESLRGSDTAVYVGTMSVDYNDIVLKDIESAPTYFATGSSRAILSNRVSYFFDWHGPSMTIDTACSSSLVALHQCVQSLRAGESRVGIAGGTSLLLGPEQFVGESKMNLLSPDGRSRMWDADANGYARGDGVAAVVLKKLSDAIADGDHIECILRETGVNQDGKSSGLTVPSSEAQAALIRETYGRAGLDISNPQNWPQFFEAHGTGTKAGDPREAAAIHQCFGGQSENGHPLFVGSIKTIIGHTEGTAGLAGVLKASLAIQNSTIPPNMLLQRLNPDIEKYYDNLRVPTSATQWPSLADGVPRRASVNSFGFGGTNGHAILESYAPSMSTAKPTGDNIEPFTPFTFSAVAEESLVALLQDYSDFLKANENINLRDLAWTLQSRRSALACKVSFSAFTLETLISKIDRTLAQTKANPTTSIGVRSTPAQPRTLGVFTGQGAQWPTMGAYLIQNSAIVREKLDQLDKSLATLPEADRPSWRIAEQLSAGKAVSRLSEAAFSQPLCTAIQLVLVDLLRSAGITFTAVIGHSSGEIAAAYAADFITAYDAIRIAYYRGMHAHRAKGPEGQKGAMLAVGTSWEDAEELIELPAFKGRVKIAAQNSAASLTLSGNADSLARAKMVFDEEKKFARMLLVDTAYHSHHMLPSSEPYVQSLRNCNIQVNRNRNTSCSWYSSVKSGKLMEPGDELCNLYWRDNMVNAVLFKDAVAATTDEKLNLAIEVGPHPALKGPAQQTISDIRSPLPYTGVLSRGSNDVDAFSDALGFVWTHLGSGAVDFESYRKMVSPGPSPKLVTDLPSYHWNHKRIHWHESRLAKKARLRGAGFHELLGVPSPNDTDRDLRWRNYLKANEIPWLDGHQLQGQTVFPAAGYVAMAFEAGKKLAGDRSVQVFEVRDLVIGKAITFDDGANFAAETLVTLTGITPSNGSALTQTADFSVYSCPNTGSIDMELVSSGKVSIIYGNPSFSTLCATPVDHSNMTEVDDETFYSSLDELGYGYSGPFRTLSSLKRRLGQASATVSTYGYNDEDDAFVVHPTMLDVAFQASFLALSSPGDERLWSLHIPTSIKCVRVNPELSASLPISSTKLPLSVAIRESEAMSMRSSVDIFSGNGQQTLIQVEDLVLKPFSPATAADDRLLFSKTHYDVAAPNGNSIIRDDSPSAEDIEIANVCERVAYYYLRKLKSEIPATQWDTGEKSQQSLQNSMYQLLSIVDNGQKSWVKKEWADDSYDQIKDLIRKFSEDVDLNLISAIGKNMPSVVRGHSTDPVTLEPLLQAYTLDDLYNEGLGFAQYNKYLARMVHQITHRYPHLNILEIGARTGHATKAVLDTIGNTFSSYTYTDSSPEFFDNAAERFKAYGQKMVYKAFNPDETPSSQEFKEHLYDVVIASHSLHATSSIQERLQNIRRLLKPGGFLLVSGITNDGPLRIQMMLSGLSESWAALGDSRKKGPSKIATWHTALRKNGFSGVDTVTPEISGLAWPFAVFTSQAIDDRISLLRQPLSTSSSVHLDSLVILGNGSLETSRLAEEISELTGRFCDKITVLDGLPTDDDAISPMSTFINLVDLDEPIFENITEEKMEGLKCLFELSNNIVWVTKGARADEPYYSASIGFGRSVSYEMPHLYLQFLDLPNAGQSSSRLITEAILRLTAMDKWDTKGTLSEELLWSKEPEFYLQGGQLLVPRILSHDEQNGRINSLRRNVSKDIDPKSSMVYVSSAADKSLVLREKLISQPPREGESAIQIQYSVLTALNVASDMFMFLGLGTKESTGESVITLSDIITSKTISSIVLSTDIPAGQESNFLTALASQLLAMTLVSTVHSNCHLLVHEPGQNSYFASSLAQQAVAKNIRVTFSTTKPDVKDPAWITLNPWTSEHIVKEMIPAGLTHFLDLSADNEGMIAGLSIKECLPLGCRQINVSDLLRFESLIPMSDDDSILKILKEAITYTKATAFDEISSQPIHLNYINSASGFHYPPKIIDWGSEDALTVQVQPIDANDLFSRNKTYLLVGLAGQLGQSICEWMSRNGAGYICLTSRSPKADETWQASMKKCGTIVKLFAMDITKKQDLERVVNEIKNTCPPIAGVANGAAIFHDAPFSEMPLEIMTKVTNPKIEGTNHLDEVFNDKTLDFFLIFSSIASICGNSGQSNYTAANAYMTGIVNRRRKRGLAGASIDIGRVAGIGYVERAGRKAKEQLIRFGCMTLSETDLHQSLAEAIRAGHPNSSDVPIITTGCRTVLDDEEPKVAWFNNPRFSHKVVIMSSGALKSDSKKTALPVRDQLATATTMEEALEILKDCFAAKLAMISQLAEGEVGHNVPLVELGIDSLVAVEVRSWFLKELKTDMPVLKVLGGGSVTDLCEQALEKIPKDLLPSIGAESSTKAKTGDPKPLGPESTAKPITSSESERSGMSSEGTSSGSHTPPDTPATQLSQSPSTLDLGMDTGKTVSQTVDMEPRPAYVRSEVISFAQSRFWFLRLLIEDQTTYNISICCRVTGNLRVGDLERAVRLVGSRHESLRTCFIGDDKEADLAYQKVLPNSTIRLDRKEIKSIEDIKPEYEAMKVVPYDIASGNLMRLVLLTLSPTENYLLVGYHHILMDGVGFQAFLSDLEKAYQRKSLGGPPAQLPDISKIQRDHYENGSMDDEISYWRNEFPDGSPVLPLLPMSKVSSRMPMKSFDVHQVEYWPKPELIARVKEMSRTLRSTTFHFYLAVFRAMLFRFTDAQDLTIGIADANRNGKDDMGIVGLLLNLLTLRFKSEPNQKFSDCVAEARDKAYGALTNSRVPFDVLLKELNVPRSSSYSPLFQAFFDYRQGQQEKRPFGNTDLQFIELHPGRTAYDMVLDVTESPEGVVILFRTQTNLYDMAATESLLDAYVNLLEAFSSDTSLAIEKPPLFSNEAGIHALSVGRGPNLQSSWPGTLPHRIDQIVEEKRDEVALNDGHNNTLTYAGMLDRIEAIAEALQKAGVGEGSRILVFEDATVDWPCSMLAIMRLGAVYVPLDLRNPLPRLAEVAASCQPAAILVDDTTVGDVPQVNVTAARVINVSFIGPKPSAHISNHASAESVAAILYTSGSTGKPKGIVIKHSGLRNEIEGYTKQWGLKAERVLQQSAFTFNHSSDQIYTGLTNGGSVYIVPWSKRGDPIEVSKIICDEGITYTKATPAEYLLWLDYGRPNLGQASKWRFAFGGGEPLTRTLTNKLVELDLPLLRFFNSYGPTEISISSNKMEIAYREKTSDDRIPCGFALPNYAMYILDDQLKPAPIGMPGELWIGGAGVSLGYLNNKELTDYHFVPDPYATPEYTAQGWTTMYRTGDIAHLQSDGAMVFRSRVAGDTQVKIRGLRIELGDIESNIVKAAGGVLNEAVVTLRDGDPEFLVAHVVFAPQHNVANTEAFLQHLLHRLEVPQYMIPVMAIPLERMPLNHHSKVDRQALKALPLPRLKSQSDEGIEEFTETMVQLRRVWEDVLGIKELGLKITPTRSFFTIGGNSLLIVRLQFRIRDSFGVTARLVDLLGANTLGDMAKLIDESANVQLIDWEKEFILPDISSVREMVRQVPLKTSGKVVLITGAGGFLGKHILVQLIKNPDISKIHCIGLRDKPTGTPRQLAVSSPKIITYSGDLSDPWLGLSESDFWTLASEVDAVLHMAAVRSFWDNYYLLRPSNVTPTKQLVKFAAARHIPINYISTAGVIPGDSASSVPTSVAAYPPATDGSQGYVTSRWTSEQVLERATSKLQIPTSIHRFVPAAMPNPEITVAALNDFLGFIDRMEMMPELNGTTGYFGMTAVDKAASALSAALLDNEKQQPGATTFVHHTCEVLIDIPEMMEFLEARRGDRKLPTMPGLRFIGRMKQLGLEYFVTTQELRMQSPSSEDGGLATAVLESKR